MTMTTALSNPLIGWKQVAVPLHFIHMSPKLDVSMLENECESDMESYMSRNGQCLMVTRILRQENPILGSFNQKQG